MDEEKVPIPGILPVATKLAGKEKELDKIIQFVKENPGKYDNKLVMRMKRVGMKRPDWIPSDVWTPKKLNNQAQLIARLAAYGMKRADIAKHANITESTLDNYMASALMKKEIENLRDQMFGGNPRTMFRNAVGEAFETELEIMRSQVEKGSTRLNAAQDILDRAIGKAPQELNINDSNVRSLIDRLDKIERAGGMKAIEVEAQQVSDAQIVEVGENKSASHEEIDPVDLWVKENIQCQS